MKDRRILPNGEIEEWERPRTIPDDFIYDPEIHSYYPSGEAPDIDFEAERREFFERLEAISKLPRPSGPRIVITRSTLAVPPSWRKSLSAGTKAQTAAENGLLFDLHGDDDTAE